MVASAAADENLLAASSAAEDADDDALVFHVSPKQRRMLLASSDDEFQSTFPDFVRDVKRAFDDEGVVVMRGLLDDDLLDRLDADSRLIVEGNPATTAKTFTSMKFGPAFSDTALREAALRSGIPRLVAAVLLDMGVGGGEGGKRGGGPTTSLHLLKDAFLAKGGEKACCGWHVDDAGFWPTSARSIPGVNAWIAIDDIPATCGGGLAVSPRSHRASWRQRAYEVVGSTRLDPEEGRAEMGPFVTCNMEENDPELASAIDGTQKVFDFQRGDVLLHTRWLFHRSMPLTSEGKERFRRLGEEPTLRRYSVRYERADSRLLRGMNFEFAALLNPENKGRTLAEVNEAEGPFYPRCWPEVLSNEELERMDRLVAEKFPLAEAKRKEIIASMMRGGSMTK